MNKNLKRIIAIALVVGTVSAVAPATNVNLLTTKAYASTTNDTDTLDSLKLETSSGSTIKLYSDNDYASSNKVDSTSVSNGDTYYAKASDSTIKLSTGGPSSKYVKVFKGTSSSTKGKSLSSNISLSSGTTTLTVRVYGSTPDSSVTYSDDTDVVSEYVIKVKCTASDSSSSSSSDSYDDIYLSSLTVSDGTINFSKTESTYSFDVANDVDQITIKAKPEDTSYEVTIDGSTVDDSDNYKKTVSIDKGQNTIEVGITNTDDDTNRVYTLNVNRTSSSSTSTSTTTTATATTTPNTATDVATTTVKASQWVQVNGAWQYNDATGNTIKNSWFYDKNYGENYYLQADGNMNTGWLSNNGKWYYLGSDGAMKTGWQSVGGTWYYLDLQGVMAYNTTISGYKLGANGAWVN